jgi:hypothetical protein
MEWANQFNRLFCDVASSQWCLATDCSNVDLAVELMLVSGAAAKSPVVRWGFREGDLQIHGGDSVSFFDALEEQVDELLFGFDRPARDHTEL